MPPHPCPTCGAPCVVRTSEQQTALSRLFYLRCTNAICGWAGTGVFEITATISPPSRFYRDSGNTPPEISGCAEAAVLAELAELDKSQGE